MVASEYGCQPGEVIRFPKVVESLLRLRHDLKRTYMLLPKDSSGKVNRAELRNIERLNMELDEYLRIGEGIEREKDIKS